MQESGLAYKIFKARWILIAITPFLWFFTFVTLFAGGPANLHRFILFLNFLTFALYILNLIISIKIKNKEFITVSIAMLIVYSGFIWLNYFWGIEYTITALTVGS